MNWLNIYKPQKLSEFKFNKDEINKAIDWINKYKNNDKTIPKVLYILGCSGIGKTLLAELILKEYNYQIIELNSGVLIIILSLLSLLSLLSS